LDRKEGLLFEKRSKNFYLLGARVAAARVFGLQKFFGSFFQKRTASFSGILASIFLVQTSLAVVLLAILVPPLQNSDEPNHMNRVDQIASFKLLAKRYDGPATSGGRVDLGISKVDGIAGGIRFHQARKFTADIRRLAEAVAYGKRGYVTFSNTSIYAPFLYFPAAIAAAAGKRAGLTVTQTIVAARAANGLVCVGIAAGAIAMAGETALLLFVVLSLPMTVSLFAAISQDGLMLAAAAMACALTVRIATGGAAAVQKRRLLGLTTALAMLAVGRPAYLPLAAVPLVLPGIAAWQRVAGAACVIMAAGAWSAIAAETSMINTFAVFGTNPAAQMHFLVQHPAHIWALAIHALAANQGMEGRPIYQEFVGILGSLDVFLPEWFYALAAFVLIGAVLATQAAPLSRGAKLLVAAAVVTALVAIYALLYITFTPVGAPLVEGVQGRYFLPLALMAPCFLPRWPRWVAAAAVYGRVPLVAYSTLSMIVAVSSVYGRYY
jgi:uncharacterized membrane protein